MSTVAIQDKWLTVTQAATMIGVTAGRVRQLIMAGEVRAEQIPAKENGRWLVPLSEAKRVAELQPVTGRPRSGKK